MKPKLTCRYCGATTLNGLCPFCVNTINFHTDSDLDSIMKIMSEKAASNIARWVSRHQ